MILTTLALLLLSTPFQQPLDGKRINRIFVHDASHSSEILFEYANAALPEGAVFRKELADCLVTELMATGLFKDVNVKPKPVPGGQLLDLDITPTWLGQVDEVVVDDIVLEDFRDVDVDGVRANLQRRGLELGVPLLRQSLLKLKRMIRSAANDTSRLDPQITERVNSEFFYLIVRVRPVAPFRVKLIVAPRHKSPC